MARKKAIKPTHYYTNTKMPVTYITIKHNVDYRTIVSTIMYMLESGHEEITVNSVTEKIHHLFYWRGCDFFDSFELDAAYLSKAEQLAEQLFQLFFHPKTN